MTAAPEGEGRPAPGQPAGRPAGGEPGGSGAVTFDRHLVLDQLGGWRGMVDASLPTIAFIVGNSLGELRAGIWSAVGAAVLVFTLRLVRRESVQQAVSGLFGVAIAVGIAAASGQARDFFVPGLIRNVALGVVLVGSIVVRWPLVGVLAEFLAPSHLGAMASHSLPGLRRRIDRVSASLHHRAPPDPETGVRPADPEPERHWRDDSRMVRAYAWLTLLWGATFLVRAVVQYVLYRADEVELLGTASLVLGLPVTAVEIVVTLWVVARLHRHRAVPADRESGPGEPERPAA
ncbi:DUF3159 domain-containing protein [Geodermatophilus sabuli]|uniref:DUF3159 domain-containing protein n=1 Tax=Geodermatophilus sabuli TaxID=1564158 RepID=A0A285EDH7_9ACTN|nr:DUF3159 domain-containing protein [Geodermatophilus sabuli]MBB3085438.1 hypothetical protein [Geodermatophilus sabuli]SNX96136.1 Protein of unknown function [Geodermatophilus sabuli]